MINFTKACAEISLTTSLYAEHASRIVAKQHNHDTAQALAELIGDGQDLKLIDLNQASEQDLDLIFVKR